VGVQPLSGRLALASGLCALALAGAAPAAAAPPSTGSGYDETGQAGVLGVSGAGSSGAVPDRGGAANGAAPSGGVVAAARSTGAPAGRATASLLTPASSAGAPAAGPGATASGAAETDDDQLVIRGRAAYVVDRATGETDHAGIVVIRHGRLVVLPQPAADRSAASRAQVAACQPACPAYDQEPDDLAVKDASGRWIVVDRATHLVEHDDYVAIVGGHPVIREVDGTTRDETGLRCCVTATTTTAGSPPPGTPASTTGASAGAAGAGTSGRATISMVLGAILAALALLGGGWLMRRGWERRGRPTGRGRPWPGV
jgi:hypothetical protein